MKSIPFITLFLLFHSAVFSQVFRIDSIPQEGILLNKGWKFHAGDNPEWAKPDFDDSKWESIDPTKDVMELKRLSEKPIIWLRFNLLIQNEFDNRLFALIVKQTGASEIYLNGKLIQKFGKISKTSENIEGYDPMGELVSLPLIKGKVNNLAIRFAFPKNFLVADLGYSNPACKIYLNYVENASISSDKINHISFKSSISGYIKTGIFILLSIIHLLLYLLYRSKKGNLYFGIYSIITALLFFCSNILKLYKDLYQNNLIKLIYVIMYPLAFLFVIIAINELLQTKKGKAYKTIVIFIVATIPFTVFPYKHGLLISFLILSFFIGFYTLFISYKEYKSGKKEGFYIFLAALCYIICMPISIFFRDYIAFSFLLNELIFNAGSLAIPVAISFLLATEYKRNYQIREDNFREFEKLAIEKEEMLKAQNAELQAALLQGQTIERKRVAADLHDNLGSTMSSLIWTMDAIDANKLAPEEKDVYQNLKKMLSSAYDEVRLLSHNLLPEEFEKQGLTAALQYFVRKVNQNSSIKFNLQIDDNFGKLDKKVEFELYSICLELINNIIKHSKATEARIELSRTENQVKLIIADNGIGTYKNESDGKGMKNVKARVDSLNGTWEVKTPQNQGFINEITVNI